jgi:hypothetical protein
VYLKSNKAAAPATSSAKPATTTSTITATKATSVDVETVVNDSQKDIDGISEADFADTVLSDTSLGL